MTLDGGSEQVAKESGKSDLVVDVHDGHVDHDHQEPVQDDVICS